MRPSTRISSNVSEAFGNVPIVRLNNLNGVCRRHDFYLKLEACNPSGSIKEKNAVYLINEAERTGRLKPGGTIVESSSGNFGIGLAMIGASRGYKVIIVVDAKTTLAIRRMLEAYGAQLVDLPLSAANEHGSMQAARMEKARELSMRIPGAWYPCQHLNPDNPRAHALFTAREIESAFDGAPDVIVVGISTAGQIAGLAEHFSGRGRSVRFVGVDVDGSAILGMPPHPYKMTGLGLHFVPPSFKRDVLTSAYSVCDALAFSVCRSLARKEGLLLGGSTGAIVAAGLAFGLGESKRLKILMINPDRGDRYLDTIYNDDWIRAQKLELLAGQDLDRAVETLSPVFSCEQPLIAA